MTASSQIGYKTGGSSGAGYISLLSNLNGAGSSNSTNSFAAPSPSTSNQQQNQQQSFDDLLKKRDDLLAQKDSLQVDQLRKIQTEKNNAAVQNQFKSRSNLVDLMQQLLTASRRTSTAQQRVFM